MEDDHIFAHTIDYILARPQKALQVDCIKAFRASLKWDTTNSPPILANADDIRDDFGVSIEDQVESGICLTKKNARAFLAAYGKKMTMKTLGRKYLNKTKYKDMFGREVPRLGQKAHVYTIAEVQTLVAYGSEFKLPEKLNRLLSNSNTF